MHKVLKIFLLVIVVLSSVTCWSQTDIHPDIQKYVREGLDYALELKQYNPKDLIIVQIAGSDKFYLINKFNEDFLEVNEVVPPEFLNIQEKNIEMAKDSVVGILWVKKKKFDAINISKPIQSFSSLKWKFDNVRFVELNANIDKIYASEAKILLDIEKEEHINNLKIEYPDIEIVKFTNGEGLGFIMPDVGIILSNPIVYPLEAKQNGIQGVVEIGYVVTKNGSIEDIKVFSGLGYGCTEAVIDALYGFEEQLKETQYSVDRDFYIETEVPFTLQ